MVPFSTSIVPPVIFIHGSPYAHRIYDMTLAVGYLTFQYTDTKLNGDSHRCFDFALDSVNFRRLICKLYVVQAEMPEFKLYNMIFDILMYQFYSFIAY